MKADSEPLLLMTPGPTRVPERVLRAGARPMLHHRSPEFSRELAAMLEGGEVARQIQLQIEYEPEPPFDSGSPERASKETLAVVQARLAKLGEERRAVALRVGRKLGTTPASND